LKFDPFHDQHALTGGNSSIRSKGSWSIIFALSRKGLIMQKTTATFFLLSLAFLMLGSVPSFAEIEYTTHKKGLSESQIPPEVIGNTEFTRESLRGIKAFYPVLHIMDSEQIRLSESQLRTKLELKMRLAGIDVVSEEEGRKRGLPALVLLVTISDFNQQGISNRSLELFVTQDISILSGTPSTESKLKAITWREVSIGWSYQDNPVEDLMKEIDEKSDVFINAYLSVNPR